MHPERGPRPSLASRYVRRLGPAFQQGSPLAVVLRDELERPGEAFSWGRSNSRPTSGVELVRMTSAPKRAWAASGGQTGSGSDFPLTCTASEAIEDEHALGLAVGRL